MSLSSEQKITKNFGYVSAYLKWDIWNSFLWNLVIEAVNLYKNKHSDHLKWTSFEIGVFLNSFQILTCFCLLPGSFFTFAYSLEVKYWLSFSTHCKKFWNLQRRKDVELSKFQEITWLIAYVSLVSLHWLYFDLSSTINPQYLI